MSNVRRYRLCVILLKYIPIICALLMFLHIITLMLGFKLIISEVVVLSLVTTMVLIWSHTFKFCITHKLLSLYTLIVLWCCYYQRTIGFGDYLMLFRIICLFIGILLIIKLGIKYAKNNKRITIKNS